jgi:hypothetical protein
MQFPCILQSFMNLDNTKPESFNRLQPAPLTKFQQSITFVSEMLAQSLELPPLSAQKFDDHFRFGAAERFLVTPFGALDLTLLRNHRSFLRLRSPRGLNRDYIPKNSKSLRNHSLSSLLSFSRDFENLSTSTVSLKPSSPSPQNI